MRYLKPMVAAAVALTMLAGVVLASADEGEGPTQAAPTVVEPSTSVSSEGASGGSAPQREPIARETVPGQSRWTSTTVQTTLQTPTGAGGALPAGYGDPYWFSFTAPVTLFVTYR